MVGVDVVGVGVGVVGVDVVVGPVRRAVVEAMSFDGSVSDVSWLVAVTPAVLVIRRGSAAPQMSCWVQERRRSAAEVVDTSRIEWAWLGWRGSIRQATTSAVPKAGSPGDSKEQSGEFAGSKLSPIGSRSVTTAAGETPGPAFHTVKV